MCESCKYFSDNLDIAIIVCRVWQKELVWLVRCWLGQLRHIQVVITGFLHHPTSFKDNISTNGDGCGSPGQLAALFTGQDAGIL